MVCKWNAYRAVLLAEVHRCLLLWIVAFVSIAGCGKEVDPQQELLLELTHNDVEQRRTAIVYLGGMRPVPEMYIQPLMQALNDNDPQVRLAAAEALGEAGMGGRAVLNELSKISHEHFDPQVRFTLQRSVQKISLSQ